MARTPGRCAGVAPGAGLRPFSRPGARLAMSGSASQRGRWPTPRPATWAPALARRSGTRSTSWPSSSPTLRASSSCEVSATTTARWRNSSLLGIWPGQPASGWLRRDGEDEVAAACTAGRLAMPLRAGHVAGGADGQVGPAGGQRIPGAAEHFAAQGGSACRGRRRRTRLQQREQALARNDRVDARCAAPPPSRRRCAAPGVPGRSAARSRWRPSSSSVRPASLSTARRPARSNSVDAEFVTPAWRRRATARTAPDAARPPRR
jgi:hypothetical protein